MYQAKSVHVRLQDELLHEVQEYRRSETDLPTWSEAIRRLLQQAVTARQAETDLNQEGA